MSTEEKGTGAITGITNFLFLAFILPGLVFFCFILLLFPLDRIKKLVPDLVMGVDVAIGAIVFLGLIITSVTFTFEMFFRWLWSFVKKQKKQKLTFKSYAEIIFNAERKKELGWYFWQLWGQSIMHWNIGLGVLLIYAIYKYANSELWPLSSWFSSWRDFTLGVIIANFICHSMFSRWHHALMAKLMNE